MNSTIIQPKPVKKPVSIIIGIICGNNDAIVMASDSRVTHPDFTIRDDGQKIKILSFEDGNSALVAKSGDDDLGSRLLENMSLAAKNKPLKDWQSVSDLADQVVLDEQKQLRKPFEGIGHSDMGFQDILRGFDCSLMIGHFLEDRSYIFQSDFYPGRATPKKGRFAAIGCGRPIAEFLLDGFDFSRMTIMGAVAAAIYVVEEVKSFDPRCGGPTQVGWTLWKPYMDKNARTEMVEQNTISEITKEVSRVRSGIKEERNEKMFDVIMSIGKRRAAEEKRMRSIPSS